MLWPRRVLALLIIPIGIMPALAESDSLHEQWLDAPIGRHLSILEDPDGRFGPVEAYSAEGYDRSELEVPNLGCTGSAFWLRTIIPALPDDGPIILRIPHPEFDEIDIYEWHGGSPVHLLHNGQARASGKIFPPLREFKIELPAGRPVELLIRVKSIKQLQVPVLLRTGTGTQQAERLSSGSKGIYIGMMLVLACYNLFIFISTRDRTYLRYVVYILLVFLTQLTFMGIAPMIFWPDSPFLLARASLILTLLTAVAATEFIKRFLHSDRNAPLLHKGINFFYIAFAGIVVIYFTPIPWFGYQLAQAISGIYAFYVLAIIIAIWRKGSRPAGFLLVAWSSFLIGTMVFVMKDAGVVPYNELTVNMMPLGSAIEGVLLSLALADRINILRREKELSQAESLRISKENERIIREQNVILEDKVKHRTQALEESNEHLKRTQTQLVNAEKMASLGQLTAGIAHEINNPINFITSNITPLRRNISEIVELMSEYRKLDPAGPEEALRALKQKDERMGIQESIEELDDIINSIAEGSSRTAEIVRGLRNFSRLDESDLKESDLNEGLRNTITVLAPQFRDRVKLRLELGDIPKVECFPGKVNQVFMNILTNAVQATIARNSDQLLEVVITTSCDADLVRISIADSGIGMSDEVKARIFDPFFTTKPVGEGTGLGMAIVYGIIEDHNGSIEVDSTPGVGTEFRIALPVRHPITQQRRA